MMFTSLAGYLPNTKYKFDKISNDFGLGSYIHDFGPTIEL